MAITVSTYDNAATIFAQGLAAVQGNAGSGAITSTESSYATFKINLYTGTPTFTSTHATLAEVDAANTQATGGSWSGGVALTNPQIYKTGNDAYLDADDFDYVASGSDLSATCALLYLDQLNRPYDLVDRPLLFIDFGQTETAATGTSFKIVWSSQGIFSFVVA